ncbi:MAG: glycosyltransferase [Chloroflexota bacterium]
MRVAVLSLHSCPLGRLGTRDTGGMNVYVRHTAQELASLGVAVDVFTREHPPEAHAPAMVGEGVRLVHLSAANGETKLGMYSYLPDLACAIHRFREEQGLTYDLVHSHYWLSGFAGAILSRWWGVPHITGLHTSARAKNHHLGWAAETELRAQTEADVLTAASLIVAGCQREKAELLTHYGVPPDKVAVAHAGVDTALFHPLPRRESRRRLNIAGETVVLFVGRIEPLKGVDILLEAVSGMEGRERVGVVVVGGQADDGEEAERLRRLAGERGIGQQVSFRGPVEQADLPAYYSAADVCVLPSRYETFGLVILESLACGTPVIATREGCAEEVVRPGENGWLMEQPSAAELAGLLSRVAGMAGDGGHLRRQARRSVAGFTWRLTASRLAQEYRRLIEATPKLATGEFREGR